jgi:hypothetical protein
MSGPIDQLLARLTKPREVSPGRWRCRCPAHEGKSEALSITEGDEGRVLVHCFAGCEVEAVVHALGLELHDLFPPRSPPSGGAPPVRSPHLPAQVLDVARFEIGVAAVIASDMVHQRQISDGDFERLLTASSRLDEISAVAYGRA